jgi:hypothetical protein
MNELEIRHQIARFVEQETSLDDLEHMLTEALWEDDDGGLPADALRLVSEYRNGDWTEPALRRNLWTLSSTYWFDRAPKAVLLTSGAATICPAALAATAGRSHAVESA